MPYVRKPFNPLTPTPNQVITELNQANENFDILAQAFMSNNPETFIVKNADKVDGFHASTIPAPNTIPVAGADGKITLDWLPDSVLGGSGGGGFRRIDMTNATSDYDLQVGEEAYYVLHLNAHGGNRPLRIIISGSLYQLICVSINPAGVGATFPDLWPNNTTYSSTIEPFRLTVAEFDWLYERINIRKRLFTRFRFDDPTAFQGSAYLMTALIYTRLGRKSILFSQVRFSTWYPELYYCGYVWKDDVAWTSLGTIVNNSSIPNSYYISIRRLE